MDKKDFVIAEFFMRFVGLTLYSTSPLATSGEQLEFEDVVAGYIL